MAGIEKKLIVLVKLILQKKGHDNYKTEERILNELILLNEKVQALEQEIAKPSLGLTEARSMTKRFKVHVNDGDDEQPSENMVP